MNFTKNIKWQLILAALGVSLLMTSAARAQEIDNSNFQSPATSVAGNFNTPSAAAANQAVNRAAVEYSAVSEASIMPVNQQEQANVVGVPRTLGTILAIGILLIACGLLWKSAGNRKNDTLKTHNSLSMRKAPLSNRKAQPLHS
ncbi:MAG TPA: hypothetical protein VK728_03985 [Candidatus Sulfotelmatobacter sp.]|jgi:hypothetical protein|nr:hypothetical protein [Candidatus Sulfotelmatobacter sp.]